MAQDRARIQTALCFSLEALSGRAVARLALDAIGFKPTKIRADFLAKTQKFSPTRHVRMIEAAENIDALELLTDDEEDGPSLELVTMGSWGMKVVYCTSDSSSAPSDAKVGEWTAFEGFNAAYRCLAEDVFWQSERQPSTYEAFGRSHQALPKVKDATTGWEVVDISKNPGRRSLFPGFWLQAAWQMWFGEAVFRYVPRERLLAFPAASAKAVLPHGVVFLQLYSDLFESGSEESRREQSEFRRWAGLDELEAQAPAFARGKVDPAFEVHPGNAGGRRLITWTNEGGDPVRRSRAIRAIVTEFDAAGGVRSETECDAVELRPR